MASRDVDSVSSRILTRESRVVRSLGVDHDGAQNLILVEDLDHVPVPVPSIYILPKCISQKN